MWNAPVQRAGNTRYLTGPDGRPTFFLGYGWNSKRAVPPGAPGYPPGWRSHTFSYREYLWRDESNAARPGAVAEHAQRNLDAYAPHGVNLSRIWVHWRLSPKPHWGSQHPHGDPGEEGHLWRVSPFARGRGLRPDGHPKADLNAFDPVFWDSLFNYIEACARRHILVELVLWFREWGGGLPGTMQDGDFHPENNEQGVDGRDLTDIFTDTENSRRLRAYEERFVRHVLDEAAARGCPNLVIEIDHEPSDGTGANGHVTRPPERVDAWIRHWVRFIAEHCAPSGIPVLVHHDSWCPMERNCAGSRYPYATDPELTGILQYIRDAGHEHHSRGFLPDPRPIVARQLADNWAGVGAGMAGFDKPVFVEDDGAYLATFAPAAFRRAMWESLVGGAASYDTLDGHPEGVLPEYNSLRPRAAVLAAKGHLMRFIRERKLPLETMLPRADLVLAGKATCLAAPGVAGVFFLPEGGSASIDLQEWTGPVRAEWYDPRAGGFTGTSELEGGRVIEFASPTREDWVLSLCTTDHTASAP